MSIHTDMAAALVTTLNETDLGTTFTRPAAHLFRTRDAFLAACADDDKYIRASFIRRTAFRKAEIKQGVDGVKTTRVMVHQYEIFSIRGIQSDEDSEQAFQEVLDAATEHFSTTAVIARFRALGNPVLVENFDAVRIEPVRLFETPVHAMIGRIELEEIRGGR